ncbi:hypothetical protein TNCV_3288141 [Trichonephila clavipes]|nr:hypothetical protein TNCV_3288141 [Trichonephila clavipes]
MTEWCDELWAGDQSFIPTNLGRVDEEMIPPGRGVSQTYWKQFQDTRSVEKKLGKVIQEQRRPEKIAICPL